MIWSTRNSVDCVSTQYKITPSSEINHRTPTASSSTTSSTLAKEATVYQVIELPAGKTRSFGHDARPPIAVLFLSRTGPGAVRWIHAVFLNGNVMCQGTPASENFATHLRPICDPLCKDIIDRPSYPSPFNHFFGDEPCQLSCCGIFRDPQ